MFRLDKEKDLCSWYFWLTLTYDDFWLPRTKSGDPCFDKSHCRKFFEHIRIKYRDQGITFKHFLVSEYGGNGTKRPHYHCLLMVYAPQSMSLSDQWKCRQEMNEYLVHKAWKYGFVNEKSFHGRVIRYLTKYCCKPEIIGEFHEMSPFALISPGIGEGYVQSLTAERIAQFKKSGDFTVRYGTGKTELPRYIIDKILPCSTEKLIKAAESGKKDEYLDILNNRNIRFKANCRKAQLQQSRIESNFKSNDQSFDTYAYLRYLQSNRDYAYEEFRTKIKRRKDL